MDSGSPLRCGTPLFCSCHRNVSPAPYGRRSSLPLWSPCLLSLSLSHGCPLPHRCCHLCCCHSSPSLSLSPGVVVPSRCSPFPPCEQSLTVVHHRCCRCRPSRPISCSSFPVPLSLIVPPLSLPLPTYSPCKQGLAAVVVDGEVVGCFLVT